jgi:hypothetical protein
MQRREMLTEFSFENLKDGHHLQDLGLDGGIILKYLKEIRFWIGYIWPRIGTNSGFL